MRGPNLRSTDRARSLRRRSTRAGRVLWLALRDRRLSGLKFARQQPIGPYYVDFICRERRLIVEVDGGQHADIRPTERATLTSSRSVTESFASGTTMLFGTSTGSCKCSR